MNIIQITREAGTLKQFRRKAWRNEGYVKAFTAHTRTEGFSEEDILADDWGLVEEKIELTANQIVEAVEDNTRLEEALNQLGFTL